MLQLVHHVAPTLFENFSKLDRTARLNYLVQVDVLTKDDVYYLNNAVSSSLLTLVDNFVENTIGCFPLPLSIATNFIIDGKVCAIPMAVEETSIVAAASRTAKWIRDCGEIHTEVVGSSIIGQIQLAKVNNFAAFATIINEHKQELINLANQQVVPSLVARGGGIQNILIRQIARGDGQDMVVLHVMIDTCDAMGANLINQVCEFLRQPIQNLTHETVTMCIISNLADSKLTTAQIILHTIEPQLAEKIAEASLFGYLDPYRAATSNKGVLNGMDPVLIATGNDWRAVEAGVHAYAAHSGQYRSITQWKFDGKQLIGILKAPIIVGTVGGVTRLHPIAQMCLRILNIAHANDLSRIVAAVGLAQNLGALRALTCEGIVQGHMKLHIKNLLLDAGATAIEFDILQKQLETLLVTNKKVTLTDAKGLLQELRKIQISTESSHAIIQINSNSL